MAKKKSAFICFVNHMGKSDPANKGLQLPALIKKYGDTWKNMGAAERKPYEDESKGVSGANTSAARAVNVEVERVADKETEDLNRIIVKVVFETLNMEEFKKKSFFFASFNVMLRTRDDQKYFPNEIGIVEYSISKGIVNTFHEFIDPGDIPQGYARMAIDHSNDSHKIPINFGLAKGSKRLEDGTRDFESRDEELNNLVLEIVQMLDGSKLKPTGDAIDDKFIVFCQPKQTEQVKGCFKFLCELSTEYAEVASRFIVLDIVQLLTILASRAGVPRPYAICEGDMTKSTYNYSVNTNCDYHDELDNHNCALGVAKRYCYMLSDVLCQMYDVKPTEKHYPPKSEIKFDVNEVVDFNSKPKLSRYYKRKREDDECSSTAEMINWCPPNIRAPRDVPAEVCGATSSAAPSQTPSSLVQVKQQKEEIVRRESCVLGIGRGRRLPQEKPNF